MVSHSVTKPILCKDHRCSDVVTSRSQVLLGSLAYPSSLIVHIKHKLLHFQSRSERMPMACSKLGKLSWKRAKSSRATLGYGIN